MISDRRSSGRGTVQIEERSVLNRINPEIRCHQKRMGQIRGRYAAAMNVKKEKRQFHRNSRALKRLDSGIVSFCIFKIKAAVPCYFSRYTVRFSSLFSIIIFCRII